MKNLLLLALLAFPSNLLALNLGEIRTEVRRRTADIPDPKVFFTNSELNAIINEGHRLVCNGTWVIHRSTSISLVSGTTYYSLPTDILEITRVTREYSLLKETTLDARDAESEDWEETGGTPAYYFQDRARPDQIGFHPFPNSSSSTGTVRINYIAQAGTLSSDSDVPFNDSDRYVAYHDVLVYYGCYVVFLKANDPRATQYLQLFESTFNLIRDTVGSKPNFNPGFSGKRTP